MLASTLCLSRGFGSHLRIVVTVSTISELIASHTELEPADADWLHLLVGDWQLISDLAFADLVLWEPAFFGVRPLFATGIRHQRDAEYFRRIEAVEFAVKSDDGQSPQNLRRADMVLVGLSRTSKTPLSMYLAHKGYKVANVPLVPEIPPPKELFEIDQEKIYGLIIDLNSLVRARHQRLRQLGLPPDAEYAARENIARELRWVREFYARHPVWPVVDTSGRAVEETAAEMVRIMKEREARKR